MNRERVRELRLRIEQALKGLEEQYGVAVAVKGGSFTSANVTFKVEVAEKQEGVALTREAEAFKHHAPMRGLPVNLLHEVVQVNGERYRIIGWKPRSPKYPVLVERVRDGKAFKLPVVVVLSAQRTIPA